MPSNGNTPSLLLSPNSVLANALLRSIDILRPRVHEMGIYKRYFDLIATGRKTTEIRVNDSSRRKIKKGP